MGDCMIKTWIAVDGVGTIIASSTTNPKQIPRSEGEVLLAYQHEFDLTWSQIDDLWMHKVVDGELVKAL